MSWSSCPFCTLQVVSTELERHANSHFEDEDDDDDDDLVSSSTPSQSQVENIQHGFMTLLKDCLEWESVKSTSTILSGYTDHFQSIEFEDVGWGCGWRNIQMLASHLLAQRQDAREVLFGGAGFVPDIPSLQRWLEVAWGKGFDAAGSNDFDQKIYGKRTWIGTTECAALFRSFGLRARIVDFSSRKVIGPMDRSDPGSSSNTRSVNGHQLLANWVWSYFSDNSKSGCNRVVVTEKAPLYFQHDGHSRTIVGIQMKSLPNETKQFNLLILDPAHVSTIHGCFIFSNIPAHYTISENTSSRELPEQESWMAKVYKKRCSHSEEDGVPGSCVMWILELPLEQRWRSLKTWIVPVLNFDNTS